MKMIQKSFLSYFDLEMQGLILKQLKQWKELGDLREAFLREYFSEDYSHFQYQKYSDLDPKERRKVISEFGNIRVSLSKKILPIEEQTHRILKSFLDYFALEESDIVLEILKNWKKINHPYECLIRNFYGVYYNSFDFSKYDILSSDEKYEIYTKFKSARSAIRNQIREMKNPILKIEIDFFNYFEEKDRDFLKQKLKYWHIRKEKSEVFLCTWYDKEYSCFDFEKYNALSGLEKTMFLKKLRQIILTLKRTMDKSTIKVFCIHKHFLDSFSVQDLYWVKVILSKHFVQIPALEDSMVFFNKHEWDAYQNQIETVKQWIEMEKEKMKKNEKFYIQNLKVLMESNPYILSLLIATNSDLVGPIFQSNYLNEIKSALTPQERLYLYLKLCSYQNPELTEDNILEILGITGRQCRKVRKILPEIK